MPTSETKRRAIVTGAARGLGRAMALGLAEAGHAVMVLDRDADEVNEVVTTARQRGYAGKAVGCVRDITAAGAPAAIVEQAVQQLGGVDILINNAGIGPDKIEKNFLEASPPFDTLSDEVVRLFFEVNAIAPFVLSVLPIKQGKKVAHVKVGWFPKDGEALQAAQNEITRSKVGRRARLSGTVEHVADPIVSATRAARRGLLG